MRIPTIIAASLALSIAVDADARQTSPLSGVKVTALGETGTTDLDAKSAQIVVDTGGTKSYGFLGLNTRGDLPEFLAEYGDRLGLRGRPGSREFDASWREAAARSTDLRDFQIEFHHRLSDRGARFLYEQGAPSLASNPVVLAYVADIRVQYGWSLTAGHVERGLAVSGDRPDAFLDAVDESLRSSVRSNFRSYLAQHPDRYRALLRRIEIRRQYAAQVAAGAGGDFSGGTTSLYPVRYIRLDDIEREIAALFFGPRDESDPVGADELWPQAFEQ